MVSGSTFVTPPSRALELIIVITSDFVLCQECYDQDPAEHEMEGHHFGHTMALVATYLQQTRIIWIQHQNERERERIIYDKQMAARSDMLSNDETGQFGNLMDFDDEEDPYPEFGDDSVATAENNRQSSANPMEKNLYTCFVCDAGVMLESRFFICGEYSCNGGFYLMIRPGLDH